MTATSEHEVLARLLGDAGPRPDVVRYGPHPDQVLEFYGCEPRDLERPLIVFVHGGYFRPSIDRGHARPAARALARAGFAVALPEYRRISGEPRATLEDMALLTAFLAEHAVSGWVGHSAGGTLVLLRGCEATLPPTRVVALAPVADLRRAATEPGDGATAVPLWLGGTPERLPGRYDDVDPASTLARCPQAGERLTLVHGTDDATVPVGHSTDLGPAATILPGAHHFDLIDPESLWWPEVLGAVTTHLPLL